MVHGQAIGIPFRRRKGEQAPPPPKEVAWNPTIESNLPYKEVKYFKFVEGAGWQALNIGEILPVGQRVMIRIVTTEPYYEVSKDVANALSVKNADFKLDSGFGKYEVDFLDTSIWNSSNSTITSSKIDCKNAISHIMLLYYNVGGKEYPDIPSFKVIKTGADIDYSYIDETGFPKSVRIVDGVNVLPASHNTLYSGSGRFCGFGNPGIGNSVTITQIPEYQNGFVFNGKTAYLENLNILAITDFTAIAKRVWANKDNPMNECFIHKGVVSTPISESAFMLEYEITNDTYYRSASFGGYINVERVNRPENITYQTTESYNGIPIIKGSSIDTKGLVIGAVTNNYWKGIFYKLMLYSKTIDMLSINALKNLFALDILIDINHPIFKK